MNNNIKNVILFPFNLLYKVSPSTTLKILFRIKQKYKLDLKNPKTYNEKIQWIKLFDKNPLMPDCCDKYSVRQYVKSKGCECILNELLWEGLDPFDIPYDTLPDKFVIKVTHGSTFNIICRDKNKLDRTEVVKKCNRWMKSKFLPCYGEWFYGVVPSRIIVEKFLEDKNSEHNDLIDYKVYCFNGKPQYIRMMTDRFSDLHDAIYDCNWVLQKGCNMKYPCAERSTTKPACLPELLHYAEILSSDFLHARVDFYIVNDKVYFGEITFSSGAGFDRFSSYEFDVEVGKYLDLGKVGEGV